MSPQGQPDKPVVGAMCPAGARGQVTKNSPFGFRQALSYGYELEVRNELCLEGPRILGEHKACDVQLDPGDRQLWMGFVCAGKKNN